MVSSESDDSLLNLPVADGGMNAEAMAWGRGGSAWSDYSGLAYQAAATLRSAAGIDLPSRKTIVLLLAGYLICLVPLNWLVFRLMGRLEFAWMATPVLAVLAVGVVMRVARLDIGFARRTTEVSLLEIHGDYQRAHLTQYMALYSSLSTNYSLDFPENDSAALPLGNLARVQRRAVAETRTLRTNYGRSRGVTLEPLTVYSNSTEMVHAEQIVELGGGLVLGETADRSPALKNETGLDLKGVLIMRRSTGERVTVAFVGELPTGSSARLEFQSLEGSSFRTFWDSSPVTALSYVPAALPDKGQDTKFSSNDSLSVGGMLHEAVRKTPLMPGQTRLFGYTDDRIGGLEVQPAEDQFDGRCIVIAHLTPQALGDIRPDKNIMSRDMEALDTSDSLEGLFSAPSEPTP
jgi:hypothetical protein